LLDIGRASRFIVCVVGVGDDGGGMSRIRDSTAPTAGILGSAPSRRTLSHSMRVWRRKPRPMPRVGRRVHGGGDNGGAAAAMTVTAMTVTAITVEAEVAAMMVENVAE
jgi:hypothetical protein